MTEQIPDLGIGRATEGVKASFERVMAWAKKNPALQDAIIAGVVILALLVKRKQPTGRVTKPLVDDGDPLGGIGAGVPGPDGVPEAEDVELPIPTTPPPVPTSNGTSTTTTAPIPYTPPSPMLTEISMGDRKAIARAEGRKRGATGLGRRTDPGTRKAPGPPITRRPSVHPRRQPRGRPRREAPRPRAGERRPRTGQRRRLSGRRHIRPSRGRRFS